jgi:quinol monooxygenase YgiN
MIVIAGTIPVKPECKEEAYKLASLLEQETRKEPGCFMYTFYADRNDPSTFFIFEEWESDEALAKHFQTDHMKQFMQQAPKILAGPRSPKIYGHFSSAAVGLNVSMTQ